MFNVLIVEDDPMVAATNQSYLASASGFTLAGIASSGEEAHVLLSSGNISLVLLDISMPGTDGLSLLREIRENYGETDVIMVTASAGTGHIRTALRLGIVDYIVKPFTYERFITALHTYQQRVMLLNNGESLSQDLLDKAILQRHDAPKELPKGVDATTLARIQDTLAACDQEFKMGEVVLLTGLSRVSIKKYLDYLESLACISRSLVYPPMGRPYSVYRWNGRRTEERHTA